MDVQFQSKVIVRNKEKEICLSTKEYISDYRCEKTNMVAKFKIFVNCNKSLKGTCKKTNKG